MRTEIRFAIGRTTSTECPTRALVDAARAVQALLRGQGRKALLREAEDRLSGAGRRNSNSLHTDYRCAASRVAMVKAVILRVPWTPPFLGMSVLQVDMNLTCRQGGSSGGTEVVVRGARGAYYLRNRL